MPALSTTPNPDCARPQARGLTGVLLINVGTPEAPHTPEVRRYLRDFLSDPRVIDLPWPLRWLLLNVFILPFRPAQSAALYRKVWRPEGSPLLVESRAFAEGLQKELGSNHRVVLAMRYGKPSIEAGLKTLEAEAIDRIVVFPLYPQYAASSTGTRLQHVFALLGARWNVSSVSVVHCFHDQPGFQAAAAAVAEPEIAAFQPDHVLFSFHGLPERHIRRSDSSGSHCLMSDDCCAQLGATNRWCYRAQCTATAGALAKALELEEGNWSMAFQSRLGRTPWIRPYTDLAIRELAHRGVTRLAVICPAFVADCLETLEEIGLRARDDFMEHGGGALHLVPALNAHPAWLEAAADLVRDASWTSG